MISYALVSSLSFQQFLISVGYTYGPLLAYFHLVCLQRLCKDKFVPYFGVLHLQFWRT